MVFNYTFNNISVISCNIVLEFSTICQLFHGGNIVLEFSTICQLFHGGRIVLNFQQYFSYFMAVILF
jgi:hypothetical protein